AGIGRFGRGAKTMGSELKAAGQLGREAGGLRGLMAGTALAAAAIPGPLWIAGAAIGIAAGGALLWKRHMDSVRKAAELAAREQQYYSRLAEAPTRQARVFGGLAGGARDVVEQRIAYERARDTVKD